MRSTLPGLVVALALAIAAPVAHRTEANPSAPPDPTPLVWDATQKTIHAAAGESTALFSFVATNTARETVEIRGVQAPCDCTTVQLRPRPWLVRPGEQTVVAATLEFSGKSGVYTKTLTVDTTHGSETLTMTVEIPGVAPGAPRPPPAAAPALPRP